MRFSLYLNLLFPAVAMAVMPAPLTDEQKAANEQMLSPVQIPAGMHDMTAEESAARELILKPIDSLEGLDRSSRELMEQRKRDDEKLNSTMKEFLTRSGLPAEQLITAPVAGQAKAAESDGEKDLAGETGKSVSPDENSVMVIDCEDGMYFDSEEGLMVYLRDVRVKDPRFNLRCDNQLKIYLERDKEKDAKAAKKKEEENKKADEANKDRLKTPDTSALNFSGIKSLAASGNVVVTRKDKDGKMMEARADKATYDGKTGEIILSGEGTKSIKDGENLVETSGPGSYIHMYGNGSTRIVGKKNITKLKVDDKEGKSLKMKKK